MESQPRRDHRILFRLEVFNFLYSWPPNEEFFPLVGTNSRDKRLIKRLFFLAEWNGLCATHFHISLREIV